MSDGSNRKRRIMSLGMILAVLILLTRAGWQIKQSAGYPAGGPRPSAASGLGNSGNQASAESSGEGSSAFIGRADFVQGKSTRNDVSPPLRSMIPLPPDPARKAEEDNENPPLIIPGHMDQADTVVQTGFGRDGVNIPASLLSWNGVGSQGSGGGGCNCAPPDTNGDVGPNHYVQTVNTAFQIWDKSGTSLYGPANINTIWSGFGGACQTRNDGDPVVLYDQIADRWLISQFTSASPYFECIAISTTPDPTGTWNRYAFQLSTSNLADYPHLGVWPDGYYMTVNQFNNGATYAGPRPYVFNRTQMLAGLAATFQTTSNALGTSVGSMLPSDLDGATLPPSGAPNYVAEFSNPLRIHNFHVDWNNPANTSFTTSASLGIAGFTQLCAGNRNCVPQQGTSQRVDGIGDRLMHRLAYRNFGDHESMVVTHAVDAGSGVSGVRWYEIRDPSTTATLYQQGTYSPDSTYRWMSSAAMNSDGDIAVGYSASSSSIYPSIRYTGRLASDPLGTLPQGEGTIFAGTGSQSGVNRWGDYSAMSVDPSDDCTFWYTQEYNNSFNWFWQTRIGSFRLGNCGAGGSTPTPTSTATPAPPTSTPTATPTFTPTSSPTPVSADFSLSVSPSSRTVARGGRTTYTVNLASLSGFAGSVNLSVSGLPSRTTGSFSPNPVNLSAGGTGTSTLTISTKRQSPTGTYTLTITGTGGGHAHSWQVTLTIAP